MGVGRSERRAFATSIGWSHGWLANPWLCVTSRGSHWRTSRQWHPCLAGWFASSLVGDANTTFNLVSSRLKP
jgi:hypothetical protein